MKNWLETYPHKIYASILLLDGKLIDYKIGEHYWESPFNVCLKGQITLEELKRCTTDYRYWVVNSPTEHNNIFNVAAKEWISKHTH